MRRSSVERARAVGWIAAVLLAASSQAATFIDDAGRSVSIPSPIARVITLAPSLTELVYAAGAGSLLVGTVTRSDYPPAARALARIGDFQRFDVERILTLKPDLVIAWNHGNPSRELVQLEAAGLRLFYLEPQRLDDIPRALERLGDLLGRGAVGHDRARALRLEIEDLRARHAAALPVAVFYQVWSDPLMTLNGQQIISDAIALCGGRNVFADLSQRVPQVSTEAVAVIDPEVILSAREDAAAQGGGIERNSRDPAFARWLQHGQLTAVRRRWLYTVPGDLIARQGPRVIEGARAICAALDEVRVERRSRPR